MTKEKIDEDFKPSAYNLGINDGEAAGRIVPHLHIHLIPRNKNDGGGSIRDIFSDKSDYRKEAEEQGKGEYI